MIKEAVLPSTAMEPKNVRKLEAEEICLQLSDYLNQVKVRYVLVSRLYEVRSVEVAEFIVASKELRHMEFHMLRFCRTRTLLLIQKIWQQTTSCLYILANRDLDAGVTTFVRLRFSSAFKVQGCTYFTAEELLGNKSYVCPTKTWQLTEPYSFAASLLQCIALKSVDKKLFSELLALWSCGKSSIKIILKRFLRKEAIDMVSSSFDDEDLHYFNTHLDCIRANSFLNKYQRVTDFLSGRLNGLRNVFRPSGLVVGILGRDGVGKSAFSAMLTHTLADVFEEVASFKRHPKVFYKKHIFKKSAEYHFTKPHLYDERGLFASFLKLFLLFGDFFLGYWLKVFPVKRRASLILYDRYFIDILADPLRYRIKGNTGLIRTMHRLLPKPDVWIILDLPTDILLQRKQELSYDMSEKLRKTYLDLPTLLDNCQVIPNEGQLDETVGRACAFIISYMKGRFYHVNAE